MTTPLQQLRDLYARAGLADGNYALTATGHSTDPYDPNAVQFCLLGCAVKLFGLEGAHRVLQPVLPILQERSGLPSLTRANDALGTKAVLAILDEVIAAP